MVTRLNSLKPQGQLLAAIQELFGWPALGPAVLHPLAQAFDLGRVPYLIASPLACNGIFLAQGAGVAVSGGKKKPAHKAIVRGLAVMGLNETSVPGTGAYQACLSSRPRRRGRLSAR